MKYILIIIIPFLWHFNCKSQSAETYELISDYPFDIYMYLFNSNDYLIKSIESVTNDILDERVISYGKFKFKGDTLMLTDKISGYNSLLIREDKDFLTIKSIHILIDKKFNMCQFKANEEIAKLIIDENLDKEQIKARLQEITKNTPYYGELKTGKFRKGPVDDFSYNSGFILDIREDGTYKYYMDNLLLSIGNWKRNGNMILCRDAKLNYNFDVLIKDENTLMSCFLPLDFEGYTLIRIE